ncbi:MAG: azurin [Flavobacteriaceae bacterium]|mgnify:FL=1|nr:azurin [Flavobacteriaceae bacterium]|tara:strand:- start:3216 stop:3707 length:492 start_codon:yes stop_codon:yes gene_type:complete
MKFLYPLILILPLLFFSCQNTNEKKQTKIKSSTKDQTIVEKEIEIVLNSDDLMRFDKNMLLVQSGQKITLTLNHTGKMDKSIMGHNFVLLKKDVDVIAFAEKAVLAKNNEYIPEGDEVIVYTKLLGGGESDTITFDAPEKGYYTFLCTFPGHWGLMKGKLVVK